MATGYIESKAEKANRETLQRRIADGDVAVAKPSGKKYKAREDKILQLTPKTDPPRAGQQVEAAKCAKEQAEAIIRLAREQKPQAAQTLEEWKAVADAYDPTCGMQDKATWAHDFMMLLFEEYIAVEQLPMATDYARIDSMRARRAGAFRRAVEMCDLEYIGWLDGKSDDGVTLRYFLWKNPYAPQPAVLPQELQAKTIIERVIEPTPEREDVLDAAAEAKWHIKPAKIDEMLEAIQYAILHPQKSEAQALPDGFAIYKNAHIWKLTHPALDREPVIATRLDDKLPFREVARRADVRECLIALRMAVAAKQEKRSGNHISETVNKAVEAQKTLQGVTPAVTVSQPVARHGQASVTACDAPAVEQAVKVAPAIRDIHRCFYPDEKATKTGKCSVQFGDKVYSL